MNEELITELEYLNHDVKELASIYRTIAKEHNLSDSEFYILYTLITTNEEYSQKDICDMWFLPKQTVNSGVNALIKKKFITLENDKNLNKKIIKITDLGRKQNEDFIRNVYASEQESLFMIPEKDRLAFLNTFKKYTEYFKDKLIDD